MANHLHWNCCFCQIDLCRRNQTRTNHHWCHWINCVYNDEKYLTYSGATVGELEQLAGDVHLSGNWSPDKPHIEGNAITIPTGVTSDKPFILHCCQSWPQWVKNIFIRSFVVPAIGRLNSTVGSHWALTDPFKQTLLNIVNKNINILCELIMILWVG